MYVKNVRDKSGRICQNSKILLEVDFWIYYGKTKIAYPDAREKKKIL